MQRVFKYSFVETDTLVDFVRLILTAVSEISNNNDTGRETSATIVNAANNTYYIEINIEIIVKLKSLLN